MGLGCTHRWYSPTLLAEMCRRLDRASQVLCAQWEKNPPEATQYLPCNRRIITASFSPFLLKDSKHKLSESHTVLWQQDTLDYLIEGTGLPDVPSAHTVGAEVGSASSTPKP